VCPPPLYQEKGTLKSFSDRSQQICATILAALSQYLRQNGNHVGLEAAHRSDKASTTAMGLLRYPSRAPSAPEAGHIAHTDVGSLTLLFATRSGLQVEDSHSGPGASSWLHVVPRPGTAVVNVGDALRFLANRTFRSCLHRVLPNTEPIDRYSIAYFLRPGTETAFRDAGGRVWTSLEWHNRKFEAFQSMDAGKMQRITCGMGEEVAELTRSV
jgi:isopenicillin N synthase-like dioxygenase